MVLIRSKWLKGTDLDFCCYYYAFGWEMPGRKYNTGNYRHGFNGKENDREWGDQLIQDYGFRLYNPAIGKFLSVDPLSPDYPELTPYQFAHNRPIEFIDIDGLEGTSASDELINKAEQSLLKPPSDLVAYQAGVTVASWNAIGYGLPDVSSRFFGGDPHHYSTNHSSQSSYLQGRISGDLFMLGLGLMQIEGGGAAAGASPAAGAAAPAVLVFSGALAINGAAEAAAASIDLGITVTLFARHTNNKLRPDSEADGDHTRLKRDDNGDVFKYETYKQVHKDPKTGQKYYDPQKRFDGGKPDGTQGAPHNGVETPHLQGKTVRKETGTTDVRRPTSSETPNNSRFRQP
jgi:RHS repeat-associated protein